MAIAVCAIFYVADIFHLNCSTDLHSAFFKSLHSGFCLTLQRGLTMNWVDTFTFTLLEADIADLQSALLFEKKGSDCVLGDI